MSNFKGWTSENFKRAKDAKTSARIDAQKKPKPARTTIDGKKADSGSEARLYNALKALGFDFDFQVEFVLFGPSIHKTPKKLLLSTRGVDKIALTVDFIVRHNGVTLYIDSKGAKATVTRDSRLRYRMLKFRLIEQDLASDRKIVFAYGKDIDEIERYSRFTSLKNEAFEKMLNFESV